MDLSTGYQCHINRTIGPYIRAIFQHNVGGLNLGLGLELWRIKGFAFRVGFWKTIGAGLD